MGEWRCSSTIFDLGNVTYQNRCFFFQRGGKHQHIFCVMERYFSGPKKPTSGPHMEHLPIVGQP
jgi:hypothetical protein